ncbi:MAG: 50S ribosomal protein L1 [Candidatus Bathyarchaeia archaeon]
MSLKTDAVLEAVKQVRSEAPKRKFTQSLEVIINLKDIDMKKPEGRIQEAIELPHVTGKKNRICVIATGELALKAKRAGAELVISTTDLESLATDKKRQKKLVGTYDAFLAEAKMMPLVGKTMGAILGPRGKMPRPLPPTANVKTQIERLRKTVNLRMRTHPVLQCAIGTEDMEDREIAENLMAVVSRIQGRLKRGLKNIGSLYVKTTMSPPVRIKL